MVLFLGALLVVSLLGYIWMCQEGESVSPDIFVGVEMAYDGVEDAKKLIDRTKDYTNLFVIGTPDITHNVTKLDEVSQYAIDAGLNLILFMYPTEKAAFDQAQWLADARAKWMQRMATRTTGKDWLKREKHPATLKQRTSM